MREEQTKKIIVNILTGIVVVGLLGAGYFVFFKGSGTPLASVTVSSDTVLETVTIGSEIDQTVRDLTALKQAVSVSKDIFSTPAFKNLKDFSASVPSEPIRRENPFLPTDWKVRLDALVATGKATNAGIVATTKKSSSTSSASK